MGDAWEWNFDDQQSAEPHAGPRSVQPSATAESPTKSSPISSKSSLGSDDDDDTSGPVGELEPVPCAPLESVAPSTPIARGRPRGSSDPPGVDPRVVGKLPPLFSGSAPKQGSIDMQEAAARHAYTPVQPRTDKMSSRNSSLRLDPAAVAESPSAPPSAFAAEVEEYIQFLRSHTCYDLIPHHCKLVVFDTQLPVKKAFMALVQNDIRAAPLWDSSLQQFVGMLTVTDFLTILKHFSSTGDFTGLEDHRIQTWREISRKNKKAPSTLLCIDPATSLYEAIELLITEKIHRLPVIDTESGNALSIITHKRILLFLHQNFTRHAPPQLLKRTLDSLKLGTKRNILQIQPDTKLIDALNIFVEFRVSALPIVDSNGVVVDIYAKADCLSLARERGYAKLELPVLQALTHRMNFEGVQTCSQHDTFGDVLEKIIGANVHRLIIVDQQKRLQGIISLSDILAFFIGK
eukprot:m.80563 g.80563  ORF g.80563 m.80563 type:complete len:462 (-) comp50694_c0_seq2:1309-2694(-)